MPAIHGAKFKVKFVNTHHINNLNDQFFYTAYIDKKKIRQNIKNDWFLGFMYSKLKEKSGAEMAPHWSHF